MTRVAVLLTKTDGERFEAFCRERGHKKSTLIARLIRDYLDSQGFASQPGLFAPGRQESITDPGKRPATAKGRRK